MPDLTATGLGAAALACFVFAYLAVVLEERLRLAKSKPVMLAGGLIWALVAVAYRRAGLPAQAAGEAFRHVLLDYAELLLFLLAAMTYINVLEECQVFAALQGWLNRRRFSLRAVFWLTGFLAFVISPLADNLTTALLLGTVVMAVGKDERRFVTPACVNLVVAANAGGAFSPFGDITTLMVWQQGRVEFGEFFHLVLPALANWLLPALIISLAVPATRPRPQAGKVMMRRGARRIMLLFLLTIVTAVSFQNLLGLPAAVGMMLGLSWLGLFVYYLRMRERRFDGLQPVLGEEGLEGRPAGAAHDRGRAPLELRRQVARVEWDTLLFFYGVMLCVAGLGQFGYLAALSRTLYLHLGPTAANVMVGILSSVVDNIPVMFAVLTMNPVMAHSQWLLVTLTAGVGGSLLAIGSAAGVGLLGLGRGRYTFASHLRWTPVVALGYAASVYLHLLVNSALGQ